MQTETMNLTEHFNLALPKDYQPTNVTFLSLNNDYPYDAQYDDYS